MKVAIRVKAFKTKCSSVVQEKFITHLKTNDGLAHIYSTRGVLRLQRRQATHRALQRKGSLGMPEPVPSVPRAGICSPHKSLFISPHLCPS